ncbi:hypothetical protein [uncultured Abyssibacter sp.]|uniref:hypothetical protein n=1 Tax=uncultured Abyssibacter sp. TaxID=2320202 RepID=UPI0032B1C5E5
MLGRELDDRGQRWRVVEYLADQDTWVLQATTGGSVIQPDQFGDARRRVPETRLVTAESDPALYQRLSASQDSNNA